LGDPNAAATSEADIPTLISFCTVPTVMRSVLSFCTSALCCEADMHEERPKATNIRTHKVRFFMI